MSTKIGLIKVILVSTTIGLTIVTFYINNNMTYDSPKLYFILTKYNSPLLQSISTKISLAIVIYSTSAKKITPKRLHAT